MELNNKYITLDEQYSANNYHPLPVVIERGQGIFVWDVEGNRYYDFLSSYSAVNQGHCHPKIVATLKKQAETLTLTSRAFHTKNFSNFQKFLVNYFGFEKMIPANSGAEAVETAIKMARKWGYEKKKIPAGQVKIVVCENNFHGRTISVISFSSDPDATRNFGPFTPGYETIPFNDTKALEAAVSDKNVAAFLVEPIQGEAGIFVPDEGYIAAAAKICKKNNVLLIVDEIQTGIARTGSLLASCGNCTCENFCTRQKTYTKPDVLILGKALSGGFYPVSAVLSSSEIMSVFTVGIHGSTYAGNPLACAISTTALEVVKEENLIQNTRKVGNLLKELLMPLCSKTNLVKEIRGKGLLCAMEINAPVDSNTAWEICLKMLKNGLLAKPTHGNIIRFAPPLVITEEEIREAVKIVVSIIEAY